MLTKVYNNQNRRAANPLKLLSILCLTALVSTGVRAESVLTLKRGAITVTHPETEKVTQAVFEEQVNKDLDVLVDQVYKAVPKVYLDKIIDRPIHIEYLALRGLGGGFVPPKTANEPLYIGMNSSYFLSDAGRSRLVHEWFHALHYVNHEEKSSWIREGLAQWFVYYSSDNASYEKYPGQALLEAMRKSTTPLNYAYSIEKINQEAYGHDFIYFLYLHKNCGGEATLWKIFEGAGEGATDEAVIDAALKNANPEFCGSFKQSVIQAEIARFHNHAIYPEKKSIDSHYLILPEFSKVQFQGLVTNAEKMKAEVRALVPFRPLMISGELHQALSAMKLGSDFEVVALERVYPYRVIRGFPPQDHFVWMVIRTK